MEVLEAYLYKVLIVILSYFIGSIPTGYFVYKVKKGGDIRNEGSGNVGGTNVARTVGTLFGIVTIIVDAAKGFLPVTIIYLTFPHDYLLLLFVSVAAILGHDFPIHLKFKGGKGVATSLGIVGAVCLLPFSSRSLWLRLLPLAIILGVALVVFLATKIVSVVSLSAALVGPVSFYVSRYPLLVVISCIIWSAIIFITHRENIRRLVRGEEKRIVREKTINKNINQ